jgi:hypothetical protein
MVLAIGIFFIFNEYFTGEGADLEICRQSILLRANLPDSSKWGVTYLKFKNDFPLKCKTQIIDIDYEDTNKAGKLIADTLVQCWNLFDEGKSQIFSADRSGFESYCVPCARIHFTPKVKSFYEKNEIDVAIALDGVFRGVTYKTYLDNAFRPSVGVNWLFTNTDVSINEFKFSENKFLVDDGKTRGLLDSLKNQIVGGLADVTLPRYINSSNGDIVIFFSQVTRSDDSKIFGYNPLLFYFQVNQKQPNPFEEIKKDFIEAGDWSSDMCDQFEGIPA